MRFHFVLALAIFSLAPSLCPAQSKGSFNGGAFPYMPGANSGASTKKSDGRPVSEKVIGVTLTTLNKGLETAAPGKDREKLLKAIAALQAILAEKDTPAVPVAVDNPLTLIGKSEKLRPGMTRAQVEKILGPGSGKSTDGRTLTLTWGEVGDSVSVTFTRRGTGPYLVAK